MKKTNLIIPALVSLLAVGAFLLVLNFAIQPNAKNGNTAKVNGNTNVAGTSLANSSDSNVNDTVSTNTNSTSATASWKTYTNEKFGYTVQYPKEWQITNCGDSYVSAAPSKTTCYTDAGSDGFAVSVETGTGDFETTITRTSNNMTEFTKSTISVSGVEAKRLAGQRKADSGPGSNEYMDIVFLHAGSYDYTIYYSVDGIIDQSFKDSFGHFLQAFKLTTGAKTFSSTALGVSFQYKDGPSDNPGKVAVKESGDKIYVYYSDTKAEDGQYIQKFTKDVSDSLTQAIQKKFLAGYSPDDCFVKATEGITHPSGWQFVQIGFPLTNNNVDPWWKNAEKCPSYVTANGISYFAMDPMRPSQFYYLSIGQYAIPGTGDTVPWQDTISSY